MGDISKEQRLKDMEEQFERKEKQVRWKVHIK